MEKIEYYATGKRKTAIARVYLRPGKGKIKVNNLDFDEYFKTVSQKNLILQPLLLTNNRDKFNILVKVKGGGLMAQAGAIRHGISQALVNFNSELRQKLKQAGYLRRDSRVKERKKYGLKGARRRPQFSKR